MEISIAVVEARLTGGWPVTYAGLGRGGSAGFRVSTSAANPTWPVGFSVSGVQGFVEDSVKGRLA